MAGGRPGPAPQTAKREEFARLIASGMSNAQACRIVGINARTGKRWRHGRTITSSSGRRLHYPPVINAREREISSRFLSEDERVAGDAVPFRGTLEIGPQGCLMVRLTDPPGGTAARSASPAPGRRRVR